jgi:hypothetical protein
MMLDKSVELRLKSWTCVLDRDVAPNAISRRIVEQLVGLPLRPFSLFWAPPPESKPIPPGTRAKLGRWIFPLRESGLS